MICSSAGNLIQLWNTLGVLKASWTHDNEISSVNEILDIIFSPKEEVIVIIKSIKISKFFMFFFVFFFEML